MMLHRCTNRVKLTYFTKSNNMQIPLCVALLSKQSSEDTTYITVCTQTSLWLCSVCNLVMILAFPFISLIINWLSPLYTK